MTHTNPYPSPDPGARLRLPGVFCPGRAVATLPRKPEPGRLYGMRAGNHDWVTVSHNGQGTFRWCCRSQPGEGVGNRSEFDTFLMGLREAAVAAL